MFLGFVLATSAVQTSQKSTTAVAILTPIVALGLPILDTMLAMARRAVRGRPLFSADREHIHHRLMSHGLTHRQTAVALYVACLALNGVAILLIFANSMQVAVALGTLVLVTLVVMRALGYIQFNRFHYLTDQRRRNRVLRARIREITEHLGQCRDEDEIWGAVKEFARDVGACWISLSRKLPADETWLAKHSGVKGHHDHFVFASTIDFLDGRSGEAMLELGWDDGRAEMDRDEEIALEALVELIAKTYDRVSAPPRRASILDTAADLMSGPYIPAPLRHRFRSRRPAGRPTTADHGGQARRRKV
jgi:UDP-GlcNAc:undecaprenyl-phosphate GlcNAc-1-phosphate transferase